MTRSNYYFCGFMFNLVNCSKLNKTLILVFVIIMEFYIAKHYNLDLKLFTLTVMQDSVHYLFIKGNEISRVEGLSDTESLTELVLDRNKIKCLQENSFTNLSQLRELHIEENRYVGI